MKLVLWQLVVLFMSFMLSSSKEGKGINSPFASGEEDEDSSAQCSDKYSACLASCDYQARINPTNPQLSYCYSGCYRTWCW